MKKLKVVTIVGTRPEIIRLSRLIPKLDEHTDHVLVHTGQNYHPMLSDVFFKDLELRQPDYFLDVDAKSFASLMGDVIKKTEAVLLEEKPDAVMILGDTNSSIAAIVAERLQIPVYHMEAGNRSFDHNVPEELNRRMVDHVSTFNLPYSEHARRNLLDEGIHPRFVQKTGSPMAEIFSHYRGKIEKSKILDKLNLTGGEYFVVSLHRQENIDSHARLGLLFSCLEALSNRWSLPIVVSTHPRLRKMLEVSDMPEIEGIILSEPFSFSDYCKLQLEARCVVSDSGSLSEETATLGFTSVMIRDSMERPESLESSSVLLSGLEPSHLLRVIELATSGKLETEVPEDYHSKDFSSRVLSFLFSTCSQYLNWKNIHR